MEHNIQTQLSDTKDMLSCTGKLRHNEMDLAIRDVYDYAHSHNLRIVGGAISFIYGKEIIEGSVWCNVEVVLPVKRCETA